MKPKIFFNLNESIKNLYSFLHADLVIIIVSNSFLYLRPIHLARIHQKMQLYYLYIWMVYVNSNNNITHNSPIPMIDLRENEQTITAKLYSAATEYGFFYLIGHNVSNELKNKLLNEATNFFNLNESIKNQLQYVTGTNFGYTPFEAETLNQTLSNYGDTKESFYICDENIKYDKKHGWSYKNVWPSQHLLPEFKHTTTQYFNKMKNLGHKMNEYVALSLNLSRNYFNAYEFFGYQPLPVLRIIHYLPIVSNESIGIFGTGQHTDYGIMTFLITDGTQGLQILYNNEWIDVRVPNNKNELLIVVNLGDELHMSTNGHFLSTKHRVFIKQPTDRYSAAFFWEPNLSAVIKCVDTICGEKGWNEKGKYDIITHKEHLTRKFSAAYESVKNELKKDEL
eukprot:439575_1